MITRSLRLPSVRSPFKPRSTASYHDYVRVAAKGGIIRVPLASPQVIGVANARGNRSQQEDFYAYVSLSLNPEELRLSVKKAHGVDWNPEPASHALAKEVLFVGIYDGHGGSAVSQYLRQELHGLFESVNKSDIPELYEWIKHIGGYFKRFKGGALTPWIQDPEAAGPLDLEARATQAFFEVDRNLSVDKVSQTCGATASVAILQPLDVPSVGFFSAEKLALTVAHCGDTRVLLCSTNGGEVFLMTENHHADARVESIRLRRMMGSSLITDSFGESRWMGALVNTRCLGDLRYKRFGVTPEPEVRTKLLNGKEWAYMVLVSDGVSSMLSDEEVVDLARNAPNPKVAADRILSFAEELGGEDNATAIVVPLAGWGNIQGPDKTKDLREYRRRQAVGSERQRRM
ncbi:phosphatase 2C-like domain-containing protein [Cyathus striatus]|nr:phosphatase 2C-like domain-containing protein [Cyathus striatus]